MRIIQLEYFCAVSRYHSITQASQNCLMTQPAISTAIKELEKEFSVNLFCALQKPPDVDHRREIFYQKAQELLQIIRIRPPSSSMIWGKNRLHRCGSGIPPLLSTIYFPDLKSGFSKKIPGHSTGIIRVPGSIRASRSFRRSSLTLLSQYALLHDIDKMNSCTLPHGPDPCSVCRNTIILPGKNRSPLSKVKGRAHHHVQYRLCPGIPPWAFVFDRAGIRSPT